VEESSPEYEKLKNYIFELENHLAEAQKQAYRLVKRHRGISVGPLKNSPSFISLSFFVFKTPCNFAISFSL
jgi:hypothetical protein